MSDKLITVSISRGNQPAGLLELELDPAAERYMIINRQSGELLRHGYTPQTSTIKRLLFRPEFAINADLAVLMFDDNREFNAAIADGVQLELVNANQVNL